MKLSDSDLQQLDEARVLRMQPEHKDKLLVTLISDLKEARERLNANSQNSSRPPCTDPPWSNANDAPANNATPAVKAPESKGTTPKSTEAAVPDTGTVIAPNEAPLKRKVGHQVGEEEHGRHLTLPVSFIHTHNPSHCALCGGALNAAHFRATDGHYALDIDITAHEGLAGIRVKHEKHLYGEIVCACGHKNHSQPGSCPDDPLWVNLSMNERGLVGPVLASLIVCLAKRMHLSRCRIQEYLHDWLSIDLSTSTINRCIHEAGRAVEPLEEMVKELKTAALLYADESPWKEGSQLLWLWVIISPSICSVTFADDLAAFKQWCEQHRDSMHDKTKALVLLGYLPT
jgi:transposase